MTDSSMISGYFFIIPDYMGIGSSTDFMNKILGMKNALGNMAAMATLSENERLNDESGSFPSYNGIQLLRCMRKGL